MKTRLIIGFVLVAVAAALFASSQSPAVGAPGERLDAAPPAATFSNAGAAAVAATLDAMNSPDPAVRAKSIATIARHGATPEDPQPWARELFLLHAKKEKDPRCKATLAGAIERFPKVNARGEPVGAADPSLDFHFGFPHSTGYSTSGVVRTQAKRFFPPPGFRFPARPRRAGQTVRRRSGQGWSLNSATERSARFSGRTGRASHSIVFDTAIHENMRRRLKNRISRREHHCAFFAPDGADVAPRDFPVNRLTPGPWFRSMPDYGQSQ
jgi:hypothetical protein